MTQRISNQVTLRGIPRDVLKQLKEEARHEKISLNQVLLRRLAPEERKKVPGTCAELLDLAGTWDKKRYNSFTKALSEIRKIDDEMWRS